MVSMMAGSDFIKTSTGKEGVNAIFPVALVMVRCIREYLEVRIAICLASKVNSLDLQIVNSIQRCPIKIEIPHMLEKLITKKLC